MKRQPRNPKEHLLQGEVGRLIFAAFFGFAVSFGLYSWLLYTGVPLVEARSTTVTLGILFELFVVISMRSSKPIYQIGFLSNRWMIGAVLIPFALQFLLLFTPMSEVFSLTSITLTEWLEVFVICLFGFAVFEGMKFLPKRKQQPA